MSKLVSPVFKPYFDKKLGGWVNSRKQEQKAFGKITSRNSTRRMGLSISRGPTSDSMRSVESSCRGIGVENNSHHPWTPDCLQRLRHH